MCLICVLDRLRQWNDNWILFISLNKQMKGGRSSNKTIIFFEIFEHLVHTCKALNSLFHCWTCFRWENPYLERDLAQSLHMYGTKLWTRRLYLLLTPLVHVGGRKAPVFQFLYTHATVCPHLYLYTCYVLCKGHASWVKGQWLKTYVIILPAIIISCLDKQDANLSFKHLFISDRMHLFGMIWNEFGFGAGML